MFLFFGGFEIVRHVKKCSDIFPISTELRASSIKLSLKLQVRLYIYVYVNKYVT